MAVTVNVVYEGDLRCRSEHEPTGSALLTDAPADDRGRAETFSATDLFAASLGSCILTVMGIVAARRNLDIRGARARVTKEMAVKPRRMVGRLDVAITLPEGQAYSPDDMVRFRRAADRCPVTGSLHPDLQLSIRFEE